MRLWRKTALPPPHTECVVERRALAIGEPAVVHPYPSTKHGPQTPDYLFGKGNFWKKIENLFSLG